MNSVLCIWKCQWCWWGWACFPVIVLLYACVFPCHATIFVLVWGHLSHNLLCLLKTLLLARGEASYQKVFQIADTSAVPMERGAEALEMLLLQEWPCAWKNPLYLSPGQGEDLQAGKPSLGVPGGTGQTEEGHGSWNPVVITGPPETQGGSSLVWISV